METRALIQPDRDLSAVRRWRRAAAMTLLAQALVFGALLIWVLLGLGQWVREVHDLHSADNSLIPSGILMSIVPLLALLLVLGAAAFTLARSRPQQALTVRSRLLVILAALASLTAWLLTLALLLPVVSNLNPAGVLFVVWESLVATSTLTFLTVLAIASVRRSRRGGRQRQAITVRSVR